MAAEAWHRGERAAGLVALIALLAKVFAELCGAGSLVCSLGAAEFVATPAGHAAGLLVGAVVGLLVWIDCADLPVDRIPAPRRSRHDCRG